MTRDEFRDAMNAIEFYADDEERNRRVEVVVAAFDALTAENERLRRENAALRPVEAEPPEL